MGYVSHVYSNPHNQHTGKYLEDIEGTLGEKDQ